MCEVRHARPRTAVPPRREAPLAGETILTPPAKRGNEEGPESRKTLWCSGLRTTLLRWLRSRWRVEKFATQTLRVRPRRELVDGMLSCNAHSNIWLDFEQAPEGPTNRTFKYPAILDEHQNTTPGVTELHRQSRIRRLSQNVCVCVSVMVSESVDAHVNRGQSCNGQRPFHAPRSTSCFETMFSNPVITIVPSLFLHAEQVVSRALRLRPCAPSHSSGSLSFELFFVL